jgi:carbon monoxide dehydrogenase subunit G
MTTTTHKRTVHIDAAVETVFDYVKDPRHFLNAMPGSDPIHNAITDVTTALKFPSLWGLVSDFLVPVTVWRRVCHGGVTRCSGP